MKVVWDRNSIQPGQPHAHDWLSADRSASASWKRGPKGTTPSWRCSMRSKPAGSGCSGPNTSAGGVWPPNGNPFWR
jgi:hypothetical protein